MAEKFVLSDNTVQEDDELGEINPQVYNAIARCARLLSLQMIDASFNISPQFFDSNVVSKHAIDFADAHGSFDADSRVATYFFNFETYVKRKRKKVFTCKVTFVVFYEISSECDDFHAFAFVKKTGRIACYPYFRSYVATTAALANADIPIMPTISAMPVRGKVKEG